MLEAYNKNKSLDDLYDRLPQNVAEVKDKLTGRLEDDPHNPRVLFLLAQCYLLGDELSEARHTLEALIELNPEHAPAKTELAKIYSKDNDFQKAIGLLREVTSIAPEVAENWSLLSENLLRDKQTDDSKDALKQYDMIKAFNDKLRASEKAFAKSDFETADRICRKLLQLVPNEVRTLRLLARIARHYQHYEFSTSTLARCVEARPGDIALGLEYASSLLGSRMYDEALAQCERLAEIAPEQINIYRLQAEVLYNLGRYHEAIEIYRELSVVPEKRALCLLHLGKVLKIVGDTAEAADCYHQATAIDPLLGQPYWELADLKTYRFSDSEINSMRALLEEKEVSALDKVMIGFALGKALEDTKHFEESFRHYQVANRAYTKIHPLRHGSVNDRFTSFFTAEYFSTVRAFGNDTDAAIFVVGLPRSGSTLTEQILSNHSLIDATQELDEIVSIARALNDPNQPEQRQYPYSLNNLSADQVRALAQRYLDYAKPRRQKAPYFVDKAPHNFQHIGLIKTLFPNARIIDIRRNPMASGWSLFRQFFADSFLFSYDLETIGKYYNDYVALMNHWHAVLPHQILTVNYEDLVEDFRATVGTILRYCGLEFEEACVNFHLNKRAVATPSSEQVRQPLYTDAIEHWRNYETFLEPLEKSIESNDRFAGN